MNNEKMSEYGRELFDELRKFQRPDPIYFNLQMTDVHLRALTNIQLFVYQIMDIMDDRCFDSSESTIHADMTIMDNWLEAQAKPLCAHETEKRTEREKQYEQDKPNTNGT